MLRLGLFILGAFMLFPVHLISQAQTAASSSIAQCSEKLIPYSEWHKVKTPTFILGISAPRKLLTYFGAQHSSNPADPQFAEIEKYWNTLKPTVAFYEGPNRPIAATRDETIKQAGESGLVRFLAARDGVPIVSLEPSPRDEVNFVLKKFSPEQVALFFILRETARLRERREMSEQEIHAAVTQLLERAAKAKFFDNPITNLDDLDAAYKRHWKNPPEWWQAPSAWFDPLKSSGDTGGIFTNEINQMSSGYRDLHMYTIIANAVLEGKTAFAVVGRNHVAMQAEALQCALR